MSPAGLLPVAEAIIKTGPKSKSKGQKRGKSLCAKLCLSLNTKNPGAENPDSSPFAGTGREKQGEPLPVFGWRESYNQFRI